MAFESKGRGENHETDEEALRQVINTPAAYIGMIGSQRKVGTIFGHLRADGISDEQLARGRAPIGLNLGGRQPAEVALAILAEIVQVRYGGAADSRIGRPSTQTVGRGER